MKKRKIIFVVAIICFVVIIFMATGKSSKSNGNIFNMGLVAENNGTVYYNKYEKGIFAVKDSKETQITDQTAYSINVVGDKIYYLTVENFNDVVIKCVDVNGDNLTNLATIYTSISKIFVEDGYIYYLSNKGNSGIARIDLSGQNEKVVLAGEIKDFQVTEGKIFYINSQNQLNRAEVSGEANVVVADGIMAQKIQVVDEWVYYYDEIENALFRVNENGKNKELISVLVNCEIYNVSGKYVYYLDTKNSKIARMQIEKSNKCENLVNVNIAKTKINIAKDELYYLDKSTDESQTYQMYRVKVDGEPTEPIKY